MVAKKFNTRARSRVAPFLGEEPNRKKIGDEDDIEELWKEIKTHKFDGHDEQEGEKDLNELDRIRRLQVIKEMPVPFRTRKKLRDYMYEVGGEYQGKGFSAWKYKQKLQYEKWKNRRILEWKNFMYAIELWGTTCTKIEGYAGSGVVSYFQMLRWIFQMDFFLFILILGFIIVPQVLFPSPDYAALGYTHEDIVSLENSTNISAIVKTCSSFYENNITTTSSVIDNILNFLYGNGWMEDTAMFYGHYDAYDERTETFQYDTSAAYIATNFAVFFVSLLVLVRIAGLGYQARLALKDSGLKNYAAKVYAFWDYGLTSVKNAQNKHKAIWREITLDMAEERRRKEKDERRRCDLCLLGTKRLIINLFILACLGAAGYLIYFVSVEQAQLIKDPSYASWHSIIQFLVQFMTSLAISVLNAILPMIFALVVTWESYSPTFEVNITLFRTIFLKLSSLAILVVTIYTTITCTPQDICGTGTGECASVKCWETYVGQEIYKLIIMDFLIAVLMTFFVETPRALLGKCCNCKNQVFKLIGHPTFDLPKNILDLIYGQTLFWLGVFFSPMVPAIVVIKLFLVFYMKYFSTMVNFQPNDIPFRASDTQSFYVYILLFDFIICLIPIFYVIWQIAPSRGCGPFRDLRYMYLTIGDGVADGPTWLNEALSFIVSPLVLISIIFILFLFLWYSISKLEAYQRLTKFYKNELAQEGLVVQALMKVVQSQNSNKPIPDVEALRPGPRKYRSKPPVDHHDTNIPDTGQQNKTAVYPIYQDIEDITSQKIPEVDNVAETHDKPNDQRLPISKPIHDEMDKGENIPLYANVNMTNTSPNSNQDRIRENGHVSVIESPSAQIDEPEMDYDLDEEEMYY